MKKYISVLHIDGGAGLLAGLLMLVFQPWFSRIYSLPSTVIFFLAVVNISYGIYAMLLAFKRRNILTSISLLAFANGLWAIVCTVIILLYLNSISSIGIVFLTGEALFVGFLSFYEWHQRHALSR